MPPEYQRVARSRVEAWKRNEENRHLYRLALSRMFRLMQGLMTKDCPAFGDTSGCYWCGAALYVDQPDAPGGRVYVGDLRGQHNAGCPWNEVVDFKGYQSYLEGLDGAGAAEKPAD